MSRPLFPRWLVCLTLCVLTRQATAQTAEPLGVGGSEWSQSGSCEDSSGCFPAQQIWNQGSPNVQFTLDLLVMARSKPDSQPLLIDSVTLQPLSDNRDLIAASEPGVRSGLIFFDEAGRDFELSFLQLADFGRSLTRTSANPVTFPFFQGLPANPQTRETVSLQSSLKSFEVNWRQRYGSRVSLLAGLRYWQLSEYFNVVDSAGGLFSTTDNDLYGFQIGLDAQLLRIRRSVLFATVKGGVYYDNADVQARAVANNLPLEFIDDEDVVAFAGEVSTGLLIPMGPAADLRLGYQGIMLDGVGLGPQQSNTFNIFTGSGSLEQSTVFYHGGFVGIDLFF